MRELIIHGGRPLRGELAVEGAKNAALPLFCATLLTDEPVVLENVPELRDVQTIIAMLELLGKRVERLGPGCYRVSASSVSSASPASGFEVPYELVRQMRASFLVLGPLLVRGGRTRARTRARVKVRVPLPGGCVLGARPVDLHLKGLEALGAELELSRGCVEGRAASLHGGEVHLDYPSVGATEQVLLAAALIPERTRIHNPAREPEVEDLAHLLGKMGARVRFGEVIEIEGARRLGGARHRIIPDRINAGTYLIAGAVTGGKVRVFCRPEHLRALIEVLRESGMELEEDKESVTVTSMGRPSPLEVETRPYPGFPTDLQPQLTALLTLARGESLIRETVFPSRFSHVPELLRLGARIDLADSSAIIKGVEQLEGATVQVPDIRAGAALVLAGLAARGTTVVQDEGHLARGYSDIVGDLRELGARIEEREYEHG